MINLIPGNAKKSITLEYWLRVSTSWFFLWAATFLVAIFILVPAYVLINIQVSVYENSAKIAQERITSYEEVSNSLKNASEQAKLIVDGTKQTMMNEYIALFEQLQYPGIELSKVALARSDKGVTPVILDGRAVDRESLAAFRDRLLAEPTVEAVDLPISNLAKDKDIQFTLTVTMDNEVSL